MPSEKELLLSAPLLSSGRLLLTIQWRILAQDFIPLLKAFWQKSESKLVAHAVSRLMHLQLYGQGVLLIWIVGRHPQSAIWSSNYI